jgi:hypothetical protein
MGFTNDLIRYFDLNALPRGTKAVDDRLGERKIRAFVQWLVLFGGVLIQPFFDGYKRTHQWVWQGFWGWVLFALVTAFIAFPAVYRNSFDREKPLGVLLAPIFAAGIGWQSIVSTVLESAVNKMK